MKWRGESWVFVAALWLVLWIPAPASGVPLFLQVLGGTVTLFDAPLNTNGLTAADPATTWPVTGVSAPDVAWWADDPLGASGKTTETYTATGTPTSVDTPFCPDGSHSDITSGCLTARRFDGSNQYYQTTTNGIASPASADMTVCAIFRSNAMGTNAIAGTREVGGLGEGWSLTGWGTEDVTIQLENHAGTGDLATFNVINTGVTGWHIVCGTSDYDGNTSCYQNAVVDGAGAGPGGVQAPAGVPFSIGATESGTSDFTGDIAAVFFWNSLLDATDMEELHEYFWGILDNEAAPVAFTNTGPNCCWVDGAIECFGDNIPMIGCELPPGVTGAGSPSSGFYSGQALTNSVVYSRDFNSVWQKFGTTPVVAGSSTMFRDGRTIYRLVDNDAAAYEYIQSATFDVSALGAGDDFVVCIYADADSAQTVDVTAVRSAAGSCTLDFNQRSAEDACSVTSSSTLCQFTFEVPHTDCATYSAKVFCNEWDGIAVTDVGHADMLVQVFLDQNWCPPTYTETAAAAVGAGDDLLVFDISGVSGLADVADNTVFSFTWTPRDSQMVTSNLFYLWDAAEINDDYYYGRVDTDERLDVLVESTEGGTIKIWDDTAATLVGGTSRAVTFTPVHSSAASNMTLDGSDDPGTALGVPNPPNSLDNLTVNSNGAGTLQSYGWIKSFTVTK